MVGIFRYIFGSSRVSFCLLNGALFICGGSAITEANLSKVGASAILRLGKSYEGRPVPVHIHAMGLK